VAKRTCWSIAGLEAMQGRLDEARILVDRSQGLYEDIGQSALAHANCGGVRQIKLLADEAAAAEQAFREATKPSSRSAIVPISRHGRPARGRGVCRRPPRRAELVPDRRHSAATMTSRRSSCGVEWAKLLALGGKPVQALALAAEALQLADAQIPEPTRTSHSTSRRCCASPVATKMPQRPGGRSSLRAEGQRRLRGAGAHASRVLMQARKRRPQRLSARILASSVRPVARRLRSASVPSSLPPQASHVEAPTAPKRQLIDG
jgi:hypothetical protein